MNIKLDRSRPILRRAGAAAMFAGRLTLRSPSEAGRLARSLGSAFLDYQFERMSPIPMLPGSIRTTLAQYEVTLPAAILFSPGNQDLKGLLQLVSLAKALRAQSVFEIGTYNGLTSLVLAKNLSSAIVHTLDLPPAQSPILPILATDRGNIDQFDRRIYETQPEAQRIVQHLGDSATFDFSPFHGLCQLVYVDGAHSYEYVAMDTESAFNMITATGVIVWDDYWRRVPDVSRYLDRNKSSNMFRLPSTRLVAWISDGARSMLEQFTGTQEAAVCKIERQVVAEGGRAR